jgi:4,5-DOPA dioxygenase extradiol
MTVASGKTQQVVERAPVLFIGHGSPMNAIADNSFTQTLSTLQRLYPNPKAILCVSAHWMTEGTWITHMPRPKTIHDFHGFPEELLAVQYPAPGSPEIADFIARTISRPKINSDDEMWGLDHGAWSILRHIFPKANIPVLQLSLDMEQPAQYHFDLGQRLRSLRDQGILIVGSGNVVHNLRRISWETEAKPVDWAIEFDEWIKTKLQSRDFDSIVNGFDRSEAGKLSVPTTEHYFPLLYTLGASDERDQLKFEFEGIQNGSISMRSLSFRS